MAEENGYHESRFLSEADKKRRERIRDFEARYGLTAMPDIPDDSPEIESPPIIVGAVEGFPGVEIPRETFEGILPTPEEAGMQILGGVRDASVHSLDALIDLQRSLAEMAPEDVELVAGAVEGSPGETVSREAIIDAPTLHRLLPQVEDPETIGGGLVRGAAQFLTLFIPFFRATRALGVSRLGLGRGVTDLVRAELAAEPAAFLAFNPEDPRLANVLEGMVPEIGEPLRQYLARPEGDASEESRLHGRFKNAVEGLGLGVLGAGVIAGARVVRSAFNASRAGRPAVTKAAQRAAKRKAATPPPTPDGIDTLQAEYRQMVTEQKRGTIPVDQSIKRSEEVFPGGAMSVEDVRTTWPGTALNDHEAVALTRTVNHVGVNTRQVTEGFLTGKVTRDQWLEQLYAFGKLDAVRRGTEAETGRALHILRETPETMLASQRVFVKQMSQALESGALTDVQLAKRILDMTDPQRLQRLTQEIVAQPPTAGQALETYFINNILSGPETQNVNILSSAGYLAESIVERSIAARLPGGHVAGGEALAMLGAIRASFTNALRAGWKGFTGELDTFGQGAFKYSQRDQVMKQVLQRWGMPETLAHGIDYALTIPGRGLRFGDGFIRHLGEHAELAALARREAVNAAQGLTGAEYLRVVQEGERKILANPEAYTSIYRAAKKFAGEAPFQSEIKGHIGEAVQRFRNIPGGRIIVPFVTAPINIPKFALRRTPGLAFALKQVREDMAAGGARRQLAIARQAYGGLVMATAGLYAATGNITGGGPTDRAVRETWLLSNQPYSLWIPGAGWVSYGRMGPVGMLIGIVADATYAMGEADDHTIDELAAGLVASTYRLFTQQMFVLGLSMLFNALAEPVRFGSRLFGRTAGGFIPFSALLRQTTRATDRTLTEARGMVDQVLQSIGGWGQPPKRNLWGDPIILPPGLGSSVIGEFAGAFIPSKVSDHLDDPVDRHLAEIRFPISPAPWKRQGVELTAEQRDRWIEVTGKGQWLDTGGLTLKENVGRLFQSAEYKDAQASQDSEKQFALIRGVIAKHRALAWAEVLRELDGQPRRDVSAQEDISPEEIRVGR